MRCFNVLVSGLTLLAGFAGAHPGHILTQELQERRDFLGSVKRFDLAHCAERLKARGVTQRNTEHRSSMLAEARAKRGLTKRDDPFVLLTDHNYSGLGYDVNTDPADLFTSNSSCLLTPEVTEGPYYAGGELIRSKITDDQKGLHTILDFQVIDVDTCDPIPNIYLEIWHCNATGVYSGIVNPGNGDSSDRSNIYTTFNRGIQATDEYGVAQFETIFPGHYAGPATHIHVMVHTNVTVYENGTLGNDVYASHVGQTFFDQELIGNVEKLSPYNANKQPLLSNADDAILAQEAATEGVDPLMEYTLLGGCVEEGIFAWIAFGINTSYIQHINPAAFRYAEGEATSASSTHTKKSTPLAPLGATGTVHFATRPPSKIATATSIA